MPLKYYTQRYLRKDGTVTEHKRTYYVSGKPKSGRPVCTRTKIMKLVRK